MEGVGRTRGVDGCNRQSIAELIELVDAAAQQNEGDGAHSPLRAPPGLRVNSPNRR